MKRLLLIFILIFPALLLNAQDSTVVILRKDITPKSSFFKRAISSISTINKDVNKRLDIDYLTFPHYSQDTKFGIMAAAIGVYSIDKKETLAKPSTISIIGDITTTGYYLMGIRGSNFLYNNRVLLDYSLNFSSFPSKFWGLGFSNASNSSNKSNYLREQAVIKSSVIYKLNSKNSAGFTAGYNYVDASKFANNLLIEDLQLTSRSFNYGLFYIYDKRDYAINATNGFYFKAQQLNYINCNAKPFFKSTLQFNYYSPIWNGATLALDLFSELGYGTTPWQMMYNLGGTDRMRGYYLGRYRDNSAAIFTIECRQKIYNRHSAVVWGGVGNVWGIEHFSLSHTLPNYGIGYRFELNNRVRFRVDYGFGSMWQNSLIIGINEAF